MNKIKEREFTDKQSGITSELIDQCSDHETLLNWKMTIESNIVSAQMQIDAIKGEQAQTGTYADPKRWVGINGYRRALGFLSQKIQHRLRQVNYDEKEKLALTLKVESVQFYKWVLKNNFSNDEYTPDQLYELYKQYPYKSQSL